MVVFLNGQFLPEAEAVVPVNDRGFLLGDGLFETLRVVNGKPFRFAQHLERMTRGADFLKIKPPFTPKELETICGAAHRTKSNAGRHFARDAHAWAGRARLFIQRR